VPYARYDETVAGVMAALGAIGNKLAFGLDRKALQLAMPAGAVGTRSTARSGTSKPSAPESPPMNLRAMRLPGSPPRSR